MAEARTRYELFGSVSGGADVWSTGFYGASSASLTSAEFNGNAEGVFDQFVADFWSDATIENYYADETTLEGCRVRDINAAGVTTRVATHVAAAPVPGAGAGVQLPAECAIVVSLLSEVAGGTGRGRMYLPPPSVGLVVANGLIGNTELVVLLNAMQDFFNNLNALPNSDFPGNVSIYSGVAGVLRGVLTIRMGNVWDAQRRRRNTQLEAYQTRTLV